MTWSIALGLILSGVAIGLSVGTQIDLACQRSHGRPRGR